MVDLPVLVDASAHGSGSTVPDLRPVPGGPTGGIGRSKRYAGIQADRGAQTVAAKPWIVPRHGLR